MAAVVNRLQALWREVFGGRRAAEKTLRSWVTWAGPDITEKAIIIATPRASDFTTMSGRYHYVGAVVRNLRREAEENEEDDDG
jgi:hypothetical protein